MHTEKAWALLYLLAGSRVPQSCKRPTHADFCYLHWQKKESGILRVGKMETEANLLLEKIINLGDQIGESAAKCRGNKQETDNFLRDFYFQCNYRIFENLLEEDFMERVRQYILREDESI
jgi:hypothetical protein